jgi:acyl-coenzyme A synthetase/AMP-(fatty) acid ligase/surface polysaccharide O-acyltransferase-like enzyme
VGCTRNGPLGDLAEHGARLAVVEASGRTITYHQLAERVADTARRLGQGRRLVLVEAANKLEPLVTYLAALSAGHPVLLTAPEGRHTDALVDTYDPDVMLRRHAGGEWRLIERRAGSAHTLHPELAVLLSTSGSTGSPKLVRLSAGNLRANAEAIASYLDIRSTDRACASLPMHYCYGLSVVNSNLLRGAALLLTDDSVLEPRFWRLFREHGGTSLHGVPHTFELLDRLGFDGWELPSLRYVTQAGGALAPDRVRHYARLGERRGWRMFVMYGQTEATARMAYLPPELAASHPDAVGVPVPGGSFEVLPSDIPGQGELVYHGPNVMLGYACGPADLALGRTVSALHTGDIGRRDAGGLYHVVGRSARSIKLFGLRIDLERAEQLLAARGHRAVCTGGGPADGTVDGAADGTVDGAVDGAVDGTLVVATPADDHAAVLGAVREELGLPASHVRVVTADPLPRTPSGKVDYPRLRELASAASAPPGEGRRVQDRPPEDRSVRAAFATVLGHDDLAGTDTFVGLGGDSLSYVRMSIKLENAIGHLPPDWPTTPIARLERLAAPRRPARTTTLETAILLRAAAITLIVGSHIGVFDILGGAHLLLIIAGWTFARFGLDRPVHTRSRAILRSAARIAIPSMLWLVSRHALGTEVGLTNILLVDVYARQGAVGYWFIEVLVHILLLFGLLLGIPALSRLERRYRFGFPLACLAVALVLRSFAHNTPAFEERFLTTHGVLWLFVLGWLIQRATTTEQKLVVAAAALLVLPGYFDNPRRDAIVLAGLVLLLLVPRLRLPRPVVEVASPLANASLAIYLTHYAVLDIVRDRLPGPLTLGICLAAGLAAWHLAERSGGLVRAVTPRTRMPNSCPASDSPPRAVVSATATSG